MDVRNRMADVVKLRCNACQDFLRMILKDGWQQELYKKAQYEICNETRFKDKYIPTYEKMRDTGIENYSVNDMDVTLISELVIAKFIGLETVHKSTREALVQLRDDRNLKDHSNENEEPDELYLRGLLALCNLRIFIRTVDKKETTIEDEERLAFRQKYITEIDTLKNKLDEERIELIQWKKTIDKDIQRIINSENPIRTWIDFHEIYMERYWKAENNPQKYHDFVIRASDSGIPYAHSSAASYFNLIVKDYPEGERRLSMLYHSYPNLPLYEAHNIIQEINYMLGKGYDLTNELKGIIEGLKKRGYKIEQTANGYYNIPIE